MPKEAAGENTEQLYLSLVPSRKGGTKRLKVSECWNQEKKYLSFCAVFSTSVVPSETCKLRHG